MSENQLPEPVSKAAAPRTKVPAIRLVLIGLVGLLPLVLLFSAAGTLAWGMGWMYIALLYLGSLGSRLLMRRIAPDMVAERSRFLDMKDEKVAQFDKAFIPLSLLLGLILVLIAGLDFRNQWSAMPLPLQLLGLLGGLAGGVLSGWAMAVNKFFSSVVRIQKDRGQSVVSTGPYAFVRHPGYSGGALGLISASFILGSWWSLAAVIAMLVLYYFRTDREDRLLQSQLPGYRDYALKVKYRLIPGIW